MRNNKLRLGSAVVQEIPPPDIRLPGNGPAIMGQTNPGGASNAFNMIPGLGDESEFLPP